MLPFQVKTASKAQLAARLSADLGVLSSTQPGHKFHGARSGNNFCDHSSPILLHLLNNG